MDSSTLGRAHCSQGCGPHRAPALPLPTSSSSAAPGRTHRRSRNIASRALFDPPPFKPEMLTVMFQDSNGWSGSGNGCVSSLQPPVVEGPAMSGQKRRRYTLTHNDITGALRLSVGSDYNYRQISGFYTRLLRDEVIAEWVFDPVPSLHIYCHVSGEEKWLAPPPLRNYIFRRELPLVLDTFMYADRHLLQQHPELQSAEVHVHFQSTVQELNTVERWGVLGQRHTWTKQESMLKRMLITITGWHPSTQQEQLPSQAQEHTALPPASGRTQQGWPVQAPLVSPKAHPTGWQAQLGELYGSGFLGVASPVPVIAALNVLDPNSQSGAVTSNSSLSTADGMPLAAIPLQPSLSAADEAGGIQSEPALQEPMLVVATGSSMSAAANGNGNGLPSNGRVSSMVSSSNANGMAANSALKALRADSALGITAGQLQPVHVVVAAQPGGSRAVDSSRGPSRVTAHGKPRSMHRRRG